MNDFANSPTNVLTLPARRRDDAAEAGATHRSTPAFATPVPPPLPFDGDEPFADALLAESRARRRHAANVALARNTQARLEAEQLRNNQINDAYDAGYDMALGHGFNRGWQWGLAFGFMIGGTVTYLCIKAGQWAGQL